MLTLTRPPELTAGEDRRGRVQLTAAARHCLGDPAASPPGAGADSAAAGFSPGRGDTALAQAGPIPQGSIKLLAELGHEQAGFVDEIGARMPDSREMDFFQLPTGIPVIVVNRTSYSADRPIRLTRYIYRGDRVRLAHVEGTIPIKYRDG
jgi:UTRA domain